MSERYFGVAFTGVEQVAVNAFDRLNVTAPLSLLQDGSRFGIVCHGTRKTGLATLENVAKSMSKAMETVAIVSACTTSGHSSRQLFEHGRAGDFAAFSENEDDSQIYKDIGISRKELSELFLAYKTPRSLNPRGVLAAIQLMQANGWHGAQRQFIARITRQAEVADRLILHSNYSSASPLLNEIEEQLKTLSQDTHVKFLRSLLRLQQSG